MTRRPITQHPDAQRPTRDMDPAHLATLVAQASRRAAPPLRAETTELDIAEAIEIEAIEVEASSEIEIPIELGEPSNKLRIDVTTPLDISDLTPLQPLPKTVQIDRAMILASQSIPVVGGTVIARRSWLGRIWDALTGRN